LRTAYHANNAAVLRAAQGYAYVKAAAAAHGIPAAILTAIGVRETAFRNMQEIGVGHGQGIFQIDDRYHTGAGSVGYDASAAANYAAGLVADRFTHYTDQGYGGDIAMAAAIHDYNSSAKWTPAALARGGGDIDRTIAARDRSTTTHNYVSNVLNLAQNCFSNASYFSDVPNLDGPVAEE
jgi:hypothetical protein